MRTVISTSNGEFVIKGIAAKVLGFSHKITGPIAIIFGIYGVIVGLYKEIEIIIVAGIIALISGYVLRLFVETTFERYGEKVDSNLNSPRATKPKYKNH